MQRSVLPSTISEVGTTSDGRRRNARAPHVTRKSAGGSPSGGAAKGSRGRSREWAPRSQGEAWVREETGSSTSGSSVRLIRGSAARSPRSVRNPESAEDVTQEAFLKLLQHWREGQALEQPDAWVRRVAIRMAVRHARREAGRGSVETDTSPPPTPEPDVDLDRAIANLSPCSERPSSCTTSMTNRSPRSPGSSWYRSPPSNSTCTAHAVDLLFVLGEEVAEDVH